MSSGSQGLQFSPKVSSPCSHQISLHCSPTAQQPLGCVSLFTCARRDRERKVSPSLEWESFLPYAEWTSLTRPWVEEWVAPGRGPGTVCWQLWMNPGFCFSHSQAVVRSPSSTVWEERGNTSTKSWFYWEGEGGMNVEIVSITTNLPVLYVKVSWSDSINSFVL